MHTLHTEARIELQALADMCARLQDGVMRISLLSEQARASTALQQAISEP